MRINYNATGTDRKALVKAIAEATGEKARYMKLPTYSYEIGPFTVTRDGALEYEDGLDAEAVLSSIAAAGFDAESAETPEDEVPEDPHEAPNEAETAALEPEENEPAESSAPEAGQEPDEAPAAESTGLTVELPIDKVSIGNLTNILSAKSTLIKHALGIDDLRIEVTDDKVAFPWFTEMPGPEEVTAYTHFIAALGKLSKDLKRTSSTETPVANEKYAFRCFLLRLGFIGSDYKDERKILLHNLTGNSSWKNGAPKKEDKEQEVESCEA